MVREATTNSGPRTNADCQRRQSESATDLQDGQVVIVSARWLLVVAGFIFLLYRAQDIGALAVGTVGVLGIAVANFWLHTRILMKQPIEARWIYWASAADVSVISLITAVQGGLHSKAFVFYYPAVLCFALVFTKNITCLLTAAVLSLYAGVCLICSNPAVQLAGDERILIARLLTILGVAVVGNRYRKVETQRRARRFELQRVLREELEGHGGAASPAQRVG